MAIATNGSDVKYICPNPKSHIYLLVSLKSRKTADLPSITVDAFWYLSRAGSFVYIFLSMFLTSFVPKSDHFQISPAVSPEILHHTVWRTWLFIAGPDERWSYYQFSLPHLYVFSLKSWENALFDSVFFSWRFLCSKNFISISTPWGIRKTKPKRVKRTGMSAHTRANPTITTTTISSSSSSSSSNNSMSSNRTRMRPTGSRAATPTRCTARRPTTATGLARWASPGTAQIRVDVTSVGQRLLQWSRNSVRNVEVEFQLEFKLCFRCAQFMLRQMHWTNLAVSIEPKYWVSWLLRLGLGLSWARGGWGGGGALPQSPRASLTANGEPARRLLYMSDRQPLTSRRFPRAHSARSRTNPRRRASESEISSARIPCLRTTRPPLTTAFRPSRLATTSPGASTTTCCAGPTPGTLPGPRTMICSFRWAGFRRDSRTRTHSSPRASRPARPWRTERLLGGLRGRGGTGLRYAMATSPQVSSETPRYWLRSASWLTVFGLVLLATRKGTSKLVSRPSFSKIGSSETGWRAFWKSEGDFSMEWGPSLTPY